MQITHWLLLLCWVVPHALLFLPAQPQKRWILFSTGVILLCFLYLLKPSTSDLPGYSVYFSSGFLTVNPYDVTATGAVELDPVDTTGTPFRQTFSKSPAFAVLAEAMSLIYPPGPFLPRISPIQERYVSDFPVITITLVGCVVLLVACREFARGAGIRACFDKEFWLGNLFLVLGSVFFLLGSQNTLRQFLGIALIFSCLALFSRKKYGSAIVSGLVGCLMHHWIVVFCGIL